MLHAVIMAGGSGTRFWPCSRRYAPKQFLSLIGKKPLLGETADHLGAFLPPERIFVITGENHVARSRELLHDLPPTNIVPEPMGRDTAACLGLAAIKLERLDPSGATMIALPADHFIRPKQKLLQVLRVAAEVASRSDNMVLLGIRPHRPAVEFGYIKRGKKSDELRGIHVFNVAQFKEKPAHDEAKKMLSSGDWLWNSGIFVWNVSVLIAAISKHAPALYEALVRIRESLGTLEEWQTIKTEYAKLPRISIDYAVLEKADNVVAVEAPFEWNDVGTWNSLADFLSKNKDGNIVLGKHCGLDTSSCIISGDEHLIATVGVSDLVIIHTKDATLVASRKQAADTRKLVEKLESEGFEEFL
ncbi:MAG: mannose-1-phosphate guanylyltransferase [Planctomycetota bacterium]|nr:mannose-1-phosphate guanylyltransferase [Planctomycetota bacterium]